MSLDSATPLLSELNAKFEAGDVVGGQETLSKLKILMLDFPPGSEPHSKLASEVLELGVLFTVADGDLDAFARNVAQLKPYYALLGTTPRKSHILGLNLMHLLVDNRLSEFHAELELLTEAEASHKFVSFPINLERHTGQADPLVPKALRQMCPSEKRSLAPPTRMHPSPLYPMSAPRTLQRT